MLKTSSDIWLATSFLNLLNNNLFKASLGAWWILQVWLYWDPYNAPSNDRELHTLDWKTISSKPEHRTKQPKRYSVSYIATVENTNFMWNNTKSTVLQGILLDEYGVDTPKQYLTNIYIIFF